MFNSYVVFWLLLKYANELLKMKLILKKYIMDIWLNKIFNWENINDFLIGNGSKNKLGNF